MCVVRNGILYFFMSEKLLSTLLKISYSCNFKWKTTQQHLINFVFFVLTKIILTDDMMSKHADRDICSSFASCGIKMKKKNEQNRVANLYQILMCTYLKRYFLNLTLSFSSSEKSYLIHGLPLKHRKREKKFQTSWKEKNEILFYVIEYGIMFVICWGDFLFKSEDDCFYKGRARTNWRCEGVEENRRIWRMAERWKE